MNDGRRVSGRRSTWRLTQSDRHGVALATGAGIQDRDGARPLPVDLRAQLRASART